MKELQWAKSLLKGNCTCVLCTPEGSLTSCARGIRPLLQWYEEGRLEAAWLADRIIGKAAALLLILGGARGIYAQVMTRSAAELLQRAGIAAQWGSLVETIVNRKGDGPCPMEIAVRELRGIEDAPAAPDLLRAALAAIAEKAEKTE